MSAAPLRFGVAGCGWVARDYVAPGLAAAAHATGVAAYDPDPAATLPGLRAHDSLEALVADPEVDAIYVATPNDAHLAVVEAAAAAGKAVLCEKPMAASLAQAQALLAACEAARIPYATAFDQRHHPAHVALRERVAEGALGTVCAARVVYACWVGPDWAADHWRADPDRAGGGALIDLAPHGLDLVGWLLGAELERVAALTQRQVHPYAVDDGAVLCAAYADGTLLSQHVAYNHREDLPRRRLELVGTRGMAVATDTMGQAPGGALELRLPEPRAVDFPDSSPFAAQLDAFALGVRAGTLPDPRRDLRLMELIEPWR